MDAILKEYLRPTGTKGIAVYPDSVAGMLITGIQKDIAYSPVLTEKPGVNPYPSEPLFFWMAPEIEVIPPILTLAACLAGDMDYLCLMVYVNAVVRSSFRNPWPGINRPEMIRIYFEKHISLSLQLADIISIFINTRLANSDLKLVTDLPECINELHIKFYLAFANIDLLSFYYMRPVMEDNFFYPFLHLISRWNFRTRVGSINRTGGPFMGH